MKKLKFIYSFKKLYFSKFCNDLSLDNKKRQIDFKVHTSSPSQLAAATAAIPVPVGTGET